jgi:RimJ/RimL family protein N-acetyltransferase
MTVMCGSTYGIASLTRTASRTLLPTGSVASQTPPWSLAIVLAGEPVGGISLDLGEDIERCSAEIGYWLGRAFCGRGVMTVYAAVRPTGSAPVVA